MRGFPSHLTAVLLAGCLLAPHPVAADRRDQKAADLYVEGVKLIRAGKFRQGAEKINAALARGATEPVDAQGSEQRYLARPYDPYYWLGVAQMELGLVEQALGNLEKSATIVPEKRKTPVLADDPVLWADLERRKALLLSRLEAEVSAAVPAVTPTPLALRLPERGPEPTAAPVLAGSAPVGTAPTATPGPGPSGLREALVASLGAAKAGRTVEAERLAERAGQLFPAAPQPDLLLASFRASRYLLGGARDERLLGAARAAFAAWRRKAALGHPVPPFISPRVRRLLEGVR